MRHTPHACAQCHKPVDDTRTLCPECELHFALTLLHLVQTLAPLMDMLDATVHYGGHEPTRTRTAVAPTPIRLPVLDLLVDITTYAYELHRALYGSPSMDEEAPLEDVIGTLIDDAGAPNLAEPTWIHIFSDYATQLWDRANRLLDPPDAHDIGHCPNPMCGIMLKACESQTQVTCPVCGTTSSVDQIHMMLLERLCWDSEHHGTAAQIARILTDCGIPVRANTIRQWARRGKLHAANDGRRPTYRFSDVFRLTGGIGVSY